MHPLDGPWQKLKRAESQIKALDAEIRKFLQDNCHEIVIAERDPGSEYHALRARVPASGPVSRRFTGRCFPSVGRVELLRRVNALRLSISALAAEMTLGISALASPCSTVRSAPSGKGGSFSMPV